MLEYFVVLHKASLHIYWWTVEPSLPLDLTNIILKWEYANLWEIISTREVLFVELYNRNLIGSLVRTFLLIEDSGKKICKRAVTWQSSVHQFLRLFSIITFLRIRMFAMGVADAIIT